MNKENKKCTWCEIVPIPKQRDRFCSETCEQNYNREKMLEGSPCKLSTSDKGVLGEHAVIVDLLEKDYKVFKHVNPSTPCDLIIINEEGLKKVEIKTGRRNKSTKKLYHGNTSNNDYDILAIYDLGTGEIYYKDV